MQNRILFVLNGLVALVTVVLLFSHFAHPPASEGLQTLPGPAA